MKIELPITVKIETPEWFNSFANPIARTIGETISDLWVGFTAGIKLWSGKKRIETDEDLKRYRESIKNEFTSIEEEHLQNAKLSIAGAALDSSKLFYKEEHYRMMFSKLFAKSFDSSYNDRIHPSFSSIIQQLSPLDSRLLFELTRSKCKLHRIKIKNIGYLTIPAKEDFLEYTFEDLDSSLSNLKRLGLISYIDNNLKSHGNNIEDIKNSNYYLKFKDTLDADLLKDEFLVAMSVTSFGKKFTEVCIL